LAITKPEIPAQNKIMSIQQALSSYSGDLFAAWKGEVGDDRLFYSQYNGTKWSGQKTIAGNSSVGPSLATNGASMFAAWKGEHSDEGLFFAEMTGGAWGAQQEIPGVLSSVGPSLAVFGGKIFAAWKGSGDDQTLWWASYDGTNWSPQEQIPGVLSSIGPALCEYDGILYAAWKGANNDQRLWYASYNGTQWSAQALVPGTLSSVGPSLCGYGGQLYAAWKGDSGDQRLWYASFDGTKWSAQTQIPGVLSSTGPAICAYDGKLYAMWKGSGSDERLWYASFDGTMWSAQANVPGNTGQDLPQNIGLRMQFQETTEWCWIAVATSINHFYNPASTSTQCGIMTNIGQNINKFPTDTSACPTTAAVKSVPGLAAILADPYLVDAQYVLNNPALGFPNEYIKTGGVADALNVNGNTAGSQNSITLDQITSQMAAGRPIAVDIAWPSGGGQHCVAIAGVLNDILLICDPVYGESPIQFELFPSTYQGGASLVNVVLTQPG
jgi:hypothetical protein